MIMSNLTCSFEFSGYSDYWGGMGDRGRGHGAAFAYYGRDTTLKDIVDQWVDDSQWNEHDFEDLPESVTSDDIRECIVESLTAQGRADYDSGALCEWAADCEDERECRDCGAGIGCEHEDNCAVYDENNGLVVEDDCDDYDDYCESPVVIMEIDWTDHPDYKKCPDCGGKFDPDGVDGLCSDCTDTHYGDGKLVIGEQVMIDNVDGGYGYGEIVKITESSAFINIDGKKYRRNFADVYHCNE